MNGIHIVITTLLLFAGCTTATPDAVPSTNPAANLIFRDSAGKIVARGELHLPDYLPAKGHAFQGDWRLNSSDDAFPSQATKNGAYEGHVDQGHISINLYPGMADNNVILWGTLKDGTFSGKWYHSTFAGGKAMGTFSVTAPATSPAKSTRARGG